MRACNETMYNPNYVEELGNVLLKVKARSSMPIKSHVENKV